MSWMLPRLVGVTRSNDLLLSGRVVTGAETADWGLWNGVLPDGQATLDEARRYSAALTSTVGPAAARTTKRQIYDDLLRHDVGAALDGCTPLARRGDDDRRVPRGSGSVSRAPTTAILTAVRRLTAG